MGFTEVAAMGLQTVIARNHWFFYSSRDRAEPPKLGMGGCLPFQAAPPKACPRAAASLFAGVGGQPVHRQV